MVRVTSLPDASDVKDAAVNVVDNNLTPMTERERERKWKGATESAEPSKRPTKSQSWKVQYQINFYTTFIYQINVDNTKI